MARKTNRQRIIDHGEVFTPPSLVEDMIDLVDQECERLDSRFLEPACGDGNFLAEVLRRKLASVDKRKSRNRDKWERDAVFAICSLYGIDLLPDNIAACRARLLKVINDAHDARYRSPLPVDATLATTYILSTNIVQGDALTLRTSRGDPIVFPEWSPVNNAMLKRRDFAYDHLLDNSQAQLWKQPLVSDLGHNIFVPIPVGDFPPCHYLKVHTVEGSFEQP
jgi:hypothetical protein